MKRTGHIKGTDISSLDFWWNLGNKIRLEDQKLGVKEV